MAILLSIGGKFLAFQIGRASTLWRKVGIANRHSRWIQNDLKRTFPLQEAPLGRYCPFLRILGARNEAPEIPWRCAWGGPDPMDRKCRAGFYPVVGLLGATTAQGYAAQLAAFRQGLGEIGFVEGRESAPK